MKTFLAFALGVMLGTQLFSLYNAVWSIIDPTLTSTTQDTSGGNLERLRAIYQSR